MLKFILTPEQHTSFKPLWKSWVVNESKTLKTFIKRGIANRSSITSYHVLRHLLVCATDHIEPKIIKAFGRLDNNTILKNGLYHLMLKLDSLKKKRQITMYESFNPVLNVLTTEQLDQLYMICNQLYLKTCGK